MEPVVISEGQNCGSNGVSFTFHRDIEKTIASTRSEPAGFGWQFMLMGRLVNVAPDGRSRTIDGGLLVGKHQGEMHALVLPAGKEPPRYSASSSGGYEVSIETKQGLFGGEKLRAAKVIVNDHLAMNAFAIDEYSPRGFIRKRHQAFAQTFSR